MLSGDDFLMIYEYNKNKYQIVFNNPITNRNQYLTVEDYLTNPSEDLNEYVPAVYEFKKSILVKTLKKIPSDRLELVFKIEQGKTVELIINSFFTDKDSQSNTSY